MKFRKFVKVVLFICILGFLVLTVVDVDDRRLNMLWCVACVLSLRMEFMEDQIGCLLDIEKAKLEFLEEVVGRKNE